MSQEDYYTILGVSKNATANDIKKAYKKLAVKWHPDKNLENQDVASEKFKKIGMAYDILGDAQKRAEYDNDDVIHDNIPQSRNQHHQHHHHHHRNFHDHFSHQNAHDLFERMFREMESFHDDAFMNRGFNNRQSNNNNNNNRNSSHSSSHSSSSHSSSHSMAHPFGGNSLFNDFFGGDPFAGFGDMHNGRIASSSSSSSSSSFSGGAGRSGKSVSTSTFIDSTGRKTTKTTTTIHNPDGTTSIETNEHTEEPSLSRNLLNFPNRR